MSVRAEGRTVVGTKEIRSHYDYYNKFSLTCMSSRMTLSISSLSFIRWNSTSRSTNLALYSRLWSRVAEARACSLPRGVNSFSQVKQRIILDENA